MVLMQMRMQPRHFQLNEFQKLHEEVTAAKASAAAATHATAAAAAGGVPLGPATPDGGGAGEGAAAAAAATVPLPRVARHTLRAAAAATHALAYSPNGAMLATASEDNHQRAFADATKCDER